MQSTSNPNVMNTAQKIDSTEAGSADNIWLQCMDGERDERMCSLYTTKTRSLSEAMAAFSYTFFY